MKLSKVQRGDRPRRLNGEAKLCRAGVASHTLLDGTLVHSSQTLMQEISTIVRNTCRAPNGAKEAPTFEITDTPNPKQNRALELINLIKP